MYESFYFRAVAPGHPLGVWIRHTVHKRPGQQPRGSLWFTLFDKSRQAPLMHKISGESLRVPAGGWIAVGEDGAGAGPDEAPGGWMSAGRAQGGCGPASWDIGFSSSEAELRHLGPELLYRAPLPRTKLTSPAPAATFDGTIALARREELELRAWRGMVGHNWGSQHAERWIWLHALDFAGAPDAWLDLVLARVKLGAKLTPWMAAGALCLNGRRYRLGGLAAGRPHVREDARGCAIELRGERGLALEIQVTVPDGLMAGWRYADPDGSGHDVLNCSVAQLELELRPAPGATSHVLQTPHGGAYELGVRERDHGVAIAPFPDG
jgi:hypothetical protein